MHRVHILAGLALAVCLAGPACSSAGREEVSVGDPRIAGLWVAARQFDRTRYGFTPLPESGRVYWESSPGQGYDAMLHTDTPGPGGSRTIAFRRAGNGYRWIGEQQDFTGPHEYESVDGQLREKIIINYEIEPVSGAPLNRLTIHYWGSDKRLGENPAAELTLDQVRPILAEWGFHQD